MRRPAATPSAPPKSAADDLDALVGKAPRKRSSGGTVRSIERAMEDLARRMKQRDWDEMKPQVLVALYAWFHEQVYGTGPSLKGREWLNACRAAGRMVKTEFAGDYDDALAFMRWAWKRERGRERWRRENGKGGKVINWRQQFVFTDLLTDWRVARDRKRSP